MATPIYKGVGQPAANSGWLSGLASWFGASAPVYAGAGQPAAAASGFLGRSTPAYRSAPSPAQDGGAASCPVAASDGERITLVIPRDLIESQ